MRLARVSEVFYLDKPASGSAQLLVRGEVTRRRGEQRGSIGLAALNWKA